MERYLVSHHYRVSFLYRERRPGHGLCLGSRPKCSAYRPGTSCLGSAVPTEGAAVPSQGENLNREYRMTRWPRRMTALFLAAVLAAGVSCTSDDSLGPSAPAGTSGMR